MADRVSQEAVEVVYGTTAAKARVSQEAVEVIYTTSGAKARVSQVAIEVLMSGMPPRRPDVNFVDPAIL